MFIQVQMVFRKYTDTEQAWNILVEMEASW